MKLLKKIWKSLGKNTIKELRCSGIKIDNIWGSRCSEDVEVAIIDQIDLCDFVQVFGKCNECIEECNIERRFALPKYVTRIYMKAADFKVYREIINKKIEYIDYLSVEHD